MTDTLTTDNRAILGHILSNDGATIDVDTDMVAHIVDLQSGYMVSRAGLEHVVSVATFNLQELDDFILNATPWLGQNAFIGAWISDGLVYLDVSDVVDNKDAAIHLGYARSQRAIYDNAQGRAIELNR